MLGMESYYDNTEKIGAIQRYLEKFIDQSSGYITPLNPKVIGARVMAFTILQMLKKGER